MLATKPAPLQARALPWGLIAVEALAIFLSVFLALGVTAWREGRQEAATARTAMENFQTEILHNRSSVREKLPYHVQMLESFRELQTGEIPESLNEALGRTGWRGPSVVFFQRTAWLAAEATGALALLDFETAGLLSATYALQEELSNIQQGFIVNTALDASTWDNARRVVMVAAIYFEMVTQLELQLLEAYDVMLNHLAGQLGQPQATE